VTDYALVLTKKFSGSIWELSGDDYENLIWKSDDTKPTKATLDGLWAEVQQDIADAKAANDAKVLSAKNKLKALGLTEAEVTALVG
jgi:hypothetical protein